MSFRNIGLGLLSMLLFACVGTIPGKTISNELPATIEIVRPTVVQIGMFASDFEKDTEQARAGIPFVRRSLGTGFLVVMATLLLPGM